MYDTATHYTPYLYLLSICTQSKQSTFAIIFKGEKVSLNIFRGKKRI